MTIKTLFCCIKYINCAWTTSDFDMAWTHQYIMFSNLIIINQRANILRLFVFWIYFKVYRYKLKIFYFRLYISNFWKFHLLTSSFFLKSSNNKTIDNQTSIICMSMVRNLIFTNIFKRITSVKKFTDVSAYILFNRKSTTWMFIKKSSYI